MTKTKKRKTGLANKVLNHQKQLKVEKVNPFELKINRQKHNVFGKKLTKQDQGKPGVTRSKAIKKRKETLLKEYKDNRKRNKFIDKRIGENDTDMTVEDKMMQRFALEKQRSHAASSLYNLESDELTHYGQSISEIEKFDEPIHSDDDNEIDHMGKDLSEELFGGFLEKKQPEKLQEKKSWKERMQDIIATSKKEKMERQTDGEKVKEMTLEVDKQWKYLSLIMAGCRRSRDVEDEPESIVDDYDIAVNTMKFDVVAMASDRLKSEEEIAKEEADKLKKLEAERQSRMLGTAPETESAVPKPRMRSADDLADGIQLGDTIKAEKGVRFNDIMSESDESDEDEEKAGGENSDGENSAEEKESEEGTEIDQETDSGDDIADDSDTPSLDGETVKESAAKPLKSILKAPTTPPNTDKKVEFSNREKTKRNQESEMPYTFEVPQTYSNLETLLEPYPSHLQIEVITRMRKCHHISLAPENKAKLQRLFSMILQYTCDLASCSPPELQTIDGLLPHLYHLCAVSPVEAAKSVLYHLSLYQKEFKEISSHKASRGVYPAFETLVLLRVIHTLFPTSDFKHPVVTPAILFILQILAQTPIKTMKDLATGLYLCNLSVRYVTISKKFLPEVINYIRGALFQASDKQTHTVDPVIYPFKSHGPNIDMLFINHQEPQNQNSPSQGVRMSEWLSDDIEPISLETDTHRLRLIDISLQITKKLVNIYNGLPSFPEIFSPITSLLDKLPSNRYPQSIQETITNLRDDILKRNAQSRSYLVMEKPRPRTLRQFECQVEDKFDGRKKFKGRSENKELQKLKYLHKKEMKGAIREVKQDTQFMARHEQEQLKQRDSQRKRKVKEIYSMLSMQEGEYNKLKREKNWGKK